MQCPGGVLSLLYKLQSDTDHDYDSCVRGRATASATAARPGLEVRDTREHGTVHVRFYIHDQIQVARLTMASGTRGRDRLLGRVTVVWLKIT